jgi:large subunit ribosomal protein L25
MKSITLTAEKRAEIGGRGINRMRKQGLIPAVLYGKKIEAEPLVIKYSEIREILVKQGKSVFLTLNVDGEKHAAVIKDIQYDVVKGDLMHIDLLKVSLTEKIHAEVPLRIRGREIVEKGGNIVVQHMNEVMVECLPQNTPHYIDVDISHLQHGESVTVADLKLPADVKAISDMSEVVATLAEVKEVVPEPAAEEAAAETAAVEPAAPTKEEA